MVRFLVVHDDRLPKTNSLFFIIAPHHAYA
jgi:hypothetical protein